MPILDIQQRFRELGRIRTGRKVLDSSGRTYKSGPKQGKTIERPEKLATFRVTSPWRHLIERVAELYGGEPGPWENDGSGQTEWEVTTTHVDGGGVAWLPVLIPPGEILEQWYELWTGGGCARRCDGVSQVLVPKPCACPPDPEERAAAAQQGNACKPTTRLRVMLPDVPDLGTWRIESHGFYAAAELGQAAGLVEIATRRGAIVPADLRLVLKEGARRPGKPGRRFYVPALSFRGTLGETLAALELVDAGSDLPTMLGAGVDVGKPALGPGRPELPAAGETQRDGLGREERAVEPPTLPTRAEAPPTTPAPPDAPTGSLEQAQAIAIRCREQDVDRAILCAAVSSGRTSSAKELTPEEASEAFRVLHELKRGSLAIVVDGAEVPRIVTPQEAAGYGPPRSPSSPEAVTAETELEPGDTPGRAAPPPDPEPERVTPEVVSPGGSSSGNPVGTTTAPTDSDRWDLEGWRAFLNRRGVKVTELLREASRLAREDGDAPPTTLDAFVESSSPSVKLLLVGFVEELAAQRETRE